MSTKMRLLLLLVVTITAILLGVAVAVDGQGVPATTIHPNDPRTQYVQRFFSTTGDQVDHSNNWAVIVTTSRYWFNYRHFSNALSLYHIIRSLGIPDSHILLMLPDDMACNSRNGEYAGAIYNSIDQTQSSANPTSKHGQKSQRNSLRWNVYGDDVEVDYRGLDVNVESFLRLLTDRWDQNVPRSKRLLSDANSNILLYMSGHGGDGFIKFNDAEEVSSQDLADAFASMYASQRFANALLMIDTCQAASLFYPFDTPNIITIASSKVGENSYSHHSSILLGLPIIDRFTSATLEFFESKFSAKSSTISISDRSRVDEIEKDPQLQALHKAISLTNVTIAHLFTAYQTAPLLSTAVWRSDLIQRPFTQIGVNEFFSSLQKVDLSTAQFPLHSNSHLKSANHEPSTCKADESRVCWSDSNFLGAISSYSAVDAGSTTGFPLFAYLFDPPTVVVAFARYFITCGIILVLGIREWNSNK